MTAIPSFIKVILDGVDISQREEINLEVGEKSPGGFDAATFKLCELEPPDLTAPIIIRDTRPAPHGQTIYTGRVEDVELGDDGYAITCNTGTSDRRLGVGEITPPDELSHRKTKFAADTPIMDIARYAMSRLLGSAGTGGGVYDSGHIIEFAGTNQGSISCGWSTQPIKGLPETPTTFSSLVQSIVIESDTERHAPNRLR